MLVRPWDAGKGEVQMLYAILCYHDEAVVNSWTQEQDDAVIAKRMVVTKKLAAQGKLGPVARLMPTTAATTIRSAREQLVIDGPFAETKEQLLGFYIVDCATLEEAQSTRPARSSAMRRAAHSRFARCAISIPEQIPRACRDRI